MLDVMRADPSIGIASPVILNGDANDEIEFCGGLWWHGTFHTTNDPRVAAHWAGEHPEKIWVVGTAMLLRREAAERVGPFDEKLFAYWEDNDYSVRCLSAGFRNAVVTGAIVRHWSGSPATDPASKAPHYYYYMARNEILFLRKHLPLLRRPRHLWWALHRHVRQLRRLQDTDFIDAVLLGLWDGLRGRGGAFDAARRTPAIMRLMTRTAG
jgi:GT2 family glycosyltransferase